MTTAGTSLVLQVTWHAADFMFVQQSDSFNCSATLHFFVTASTNVAIVHNFFFSHGPTAALGPEQGLHVFFTGVACV